MYLELFLENEVELNWTQYILSKINFIIFL